MGKSEILMLLAGVALSIMLAMVAIPMFSSGSEMADRQQVQQELMAINSAIPLIKSLEGSEADAISAKNIKKHLDGFTVGTGADANKLTGTKNSNLATFTVTDNKNATNPNGTTVTITVDAKAGGGVDLSKLSRLESICDVSYGGVDNVDKKPTKDKLNCVMKR